MRAPKKQRRGFPARWALWAGIFVLAGCGRSDLDIPENVLSPDARDGFGDVPFDRPEVRPNKERCAHATPTATTVYFAMETSSASATAASRLRP